MLLLIVRHKCTMIWSCTLSTDAVLVDANAARDLSPAKKEHRRNRRTSLHGEFISCVISSLFRCYIFACLFCVLGPVVFIYELAVRWSSTHGFSGMPYEIVDSIQYTNGTASRPVGRGCVPSTRACSEYRSGPTLACNAASITRRPVSV